MDRRVWAFVCVIALQGFAPAACAVTPDDDMRDAATSLAQIDFCDVGISRATRAALMKRMSNRAAAIDGNALYEDAKAALGNEPRAAQDSVCSQLQEKFETN
jgi:hypothetical protein